MIFHLGVVGQENSYHVFTDEREAQLLIDRLLNTWHNLGFAIERPLFPDAPVKEWIAYDRITIVRQMMLVVEHGENETI